MTKAAFFFGCLIWFVVHLGRMAAASYYAQINGIPGFYKTSFCIAVGLFIFGYFWNVISPKMPLRDRLKDVFFGHKFSVYCLDYMDLTSQQDVCGRPTKKK